MLLKMFLMLLSMTFFFFETDGGAGGDDGDGDDGGGGGDDSGGSDDGSDDDGADDDDGAAKLKSALQKERDARKTAVKAQKDLQRELDALKGKDQSDGQKLTAAEERAQNAEQRLREATGRTAVLDAASKAIATNLNAVYAMVRDDLEFDDEGEPTNVDDVLAQLKTDEPDLFKHSKGRGDGGSGNDGTNQREVKPGFDRLRVAYEKKNPTRTRR